MDHCNFKTVLFDFDYTLADSSRGVFECINYALEKMDLPQAPFDRVCRMIGLSLSETLHRLTGESRPELAEAFTRLVIEKGDQVMADRTVLFEAVPKTMEKLIRHGLAVGIVSTKLRRRIEAILRRDNCFHLFNVIVGGEDVAVHKPDPRGLFSAMNQLCSEPAETLYVGDSVVDAESARRAGIGFVAVLSGVTPEIDFKEFPTLGIINHVSELPEQIGGLR